MSRDPARRKATPDSLRALKGRERLPVLTAYDYPMARLLDELGMPMILVGDSLGMVVLGYPDTTRVTMEEMEHHVRAVARAGPSALILADLPFGSCDTPGLARANARRLVEAGADALKAEGVTGRERALEAILAEGIPLAGHLGMLPQRIAQEGRYRIKGRGPEEAGRILEEARWLDRRGVFGMVLELVEPSLAARITAEVGALTIGIGSGPGCDGQVLVVHDLVGAFPWFTPGFVRPRIQVARLIGQAVREWQEEVRGA